MENAYLYQLDNNTIIERFGHIVEDRFTATFIEKDTGYQITCDIDEGRMYNRNMWFFKQRSKKDIADIFITHLENAIKSYDKLINRNRTIIEHLKGES